MPYLKSYMYFILLSLTCMFIACQSSPKSSDIHLTGQFSNPTAQSFLLSNRDTKFEILLDSNGAFDTIISLIDASAFKLSYGRETTPLYLAPGTNLDIKLNTRAFDESIKYTGTGASICNFYAEKYLQREQTSPPPNELYSLGENEFLQKLKEQESLNFEFLNGYDLPDNILTIEKANIAYERLLRIADYQMAHRYFTKNDEFEVSNKIQSALNDVNLDDEAQFKSNEIYARLVSSIVVNQELETAFSNLSEIKSQIIKESILQSLKYELRPGVEKLDFVYENLNKNTQDASLKKELKDAYEKCKALAPGKKSPEFDYVDRYGKNISLNDLKGKNVYVDVWATWCGPCLAEVPSLKLMEEKYRSKNIEFVSLSIDRQQDKEKWLSMIEEKSLKGTQLMADKDWNSDFVINYNIKGIPRFILIDHEGNIVSPDAPRPSATSALEGMFAELKEL